MDQKVIIVGAKNLVIDTIMHHIRNTDGLALAQFVETAAELKLASVRHKPDCIFICPSIFDTLSNANITEFLQTHSDSNLLVGTLLPEHKHLNDLISGGVKGVVLMREVCVEELITAINKVSVGQHYFSDTVAQILCDDFFEKSTDNRETDELTERERQVLQLVADGLSSKEIARTLKISPATVGVHRRNIALKTGVRKAAAWAKLVHKAPA